MATDYDRMIEEPRRSRPFLRAIVIALLAFGAGLVAMAWLAINSDIAGNYLRRPAPAATPQALTVAVQPPPARPAPVPQEVREQALADRIDAVEQRLDDIDARASAASGNADRAEALLVAFAARRALDRGAALGYIEGLLRERFGGTQPQAVATIISAANQPVTLEALRETLDAIGPSIAGPGPDESWWQSFRRELAGLVVVRRADMPSTAPNDRLNRARAALATGQVDVALAEVSRLPGRDKASAWIADARRYALARGALDRIETAALLQPRAPAPNGKP